VKINRSRLAHCYEFTLADNCPPSPS
jgi:hypothetical protein